MASKSIFQEFNEDAIKHFGISCDPYGIMTSTTNGTIATVYLDESSCIFNKINNILTTGNTKNFGTYKKAYLLPNCSVSTDRIKSALKEHGIVLTGDYEKAEIYITHDNIEDRSESSQNISTRHLLNILWNYEAMEDGTQNIQRYCEDNMRNGEKARVVYDSKCENLVNRYNTDFHTMPYECWMLTGMAVNVAYRIDIGDAMTMDIDEVLHQSANKIELDEDLINQLIGMTNTYDEENEKLASKILPTIDYTKKKHLVWQLAQDIGSIIYRLRDKDVRYWESASGIDDFNNFTALDMIQHLENSKELNKESFKYLEPIVRKQISIHNRDLYVFKVELKPEYKKYLKNNKNE
jgi:hypothetical protein|tara:strand:- start:14205 stop:15257 length:1053 start_codon:yes stop_codon:yes gene_type:complete